MDYGKKDRRWVGVSLMLGCLWLVPGTRVFPNGLPVDEWGIRVENCRPVGSSVSRVALLMDPQRLCAAKVY